MPIVRLVKCFYDLQLVMEEANHRQHGIRILLYPAVCQRVGPRRVAEAVAHALRHRLVPHQGIDAQLAAAVAVEDKAVGLGPCQPLRPLGVERMAPLLAQDKVEPHPAYTRVRRQPGMCHLGRHGTAGRIDRCVDVQSQFFVCAPFAPAGP